MESDKKSLQSLIERAGDLHDRLNNEIDSSIGFCRFCLETGRYCDVGETPFEERYRLIAIRDSLKELQNMLMFLQKLQSWQMMDMDAGLTRLEQSRLNLIEQVTAYQGRTELDVLKELNSCFGDLNGKKKPELDVQNGKRRNANFVACCIRFCLNPWKWQKAVGIAVKLILVSASISTTIQFYQSRKKYCSSQRRILSFVESTEADKNDAHTVRTISKNPLDVFHGRG
ncbi:hypothetical protein QYF36_001988 [Acer negundo]|nr:hypothetical protein QYF36_001988 [Acer negundo]